MRCVYGVFGRDFIKQTLICARLAKPYVYGVCTVCLAGTPSYTRSHVHGWPNRTYTVCVRYVWQGLHQTHAHMCMVGQTVRIRCVYGMFGRDSIKYAVTYSVSLQHGSRIPYLSKKYKHTSSLRYNEFCPSIGRSTYKLSPYTRLNCVQA
jgi:hypothetical protein